MEDVFRLVVIGEAGKGKSTVLNYLADPKGNGPFSTGNTAKAVTTEVSDPIPLTFKGKKLEVYDVPGILDGEMSFPEWQEKLKEGIPTDVNIDMVLVIVNAIDSRAGTGSVIVCMTIEFFLKNFKYDNSVLVFTHCDVRDMMNQPFDYETAEEYAATLQKHADMDQPFEKFLFFKKSQKSLEPLVDLLHHSNMAIEENPDMTGFASKAARQIDDEVFQRVLDEEVQKLKAEFERKTQRMEQRFEEEAEQREAETQRIQAALIEQQRKNDEQEKNFQEEIKRMNEARRQEAEMAREKEREAFIEAQREMIERIERANEIQRQADKEAEENRNKMLRRQHELEIKLVRAQNQPQSSCCFSYGSTVLRKNTEGEIEKIKIENLTEQDQLLTYNPQSGEVFWDEVAFVNAEKYFDREGFVKITIQDSNGEKHFLCLQKHHYVHAIRGEAMVHIPSIETQVGDKMTLLKTDAMESILNGTSQGEVQVHQGEVTKIEPYYSSGGVFVAPLNSESLFVDQVFSSMHTVEDGPAFMFSIARWLTKKVSRSVPRKLFNFMQGVRAGMKKVGIATHAKNIEQKRKLASLE